MPMPKSAAGFREVDLDDRKAAEVDRTQIGTVLLRRSRNLALLDIQNSNRALS